MTTNPQWQELVTTALLGTSRRALTPASEEGALGDLLAGLVGRDAEARLLGAAAIMALYRRAGTLPETTSQPIEEPCEPDDTPRTSGRAAQHLSTMLGGQYGELLSEWLHAAAKARLRVSEERLPALLELGRTNTGFREIIEPVLGNRGRWLAARNPDWSYVGVAERDFEPLWDTADRQVRLSALAQLRLSKPDRARELVKEAWGRETADARAAFLRQFERNLSMDDEPFLEAALDDKSKQVREVAAELLARLPESRLVERMWESASALVTLTPQKNLLRQTTYKLSVKLSEALDKAAMRDGIQQTAKAGKGEKTSWLTAMIERVPPSRWSLAWSRTPQEIIAAAAETDWNDTLLQAWITAIKTYGDTEWAEAMLVRGPVQLKQFDAASMLDVLPPERRAEWIMDIIRTRKDALTSREITPRILWRLPTPWTVEQSRTVLRAVRDYLAATAQQGDWEMRGSVIYFARAVSPDFLQEAATIMSGIDAHAARSFYSEALDKFASIVQFRKEMLAELK